MNMRPHCRPWLPLSTQQMRLRNLIRIQGVNILCDVEKALIYYTLHHNKTAAAFYTSEPLPRRHLQQKWAEITCPAMLKSNATCVCVKVWACLGDDGNTTVSKAPQTEEEETEITANPEPISALTKQLQTASLSPHNLPRPPDKLLFTWGVYFSGLVLLSQHNDAKCMANSLIFQINGDYFASPEHFTAETLREQLSLNYQRYSSSLPKVMIPPPPDKFCINSPQVSRSSSPVPALASDLVRMSKVRYTQLTSARVDVRHSYDLAKLLQIQALQRETLQKIRESADIAADITQLSVRCITKDQLTRKRRTTSSSLHHHQQHNHHHSMGRALSVLLAEQQQVDPSTLWRAQQLQEQLESLRCRQRLLQAETQTYAARLQQLRQRLSALCGCRETHEVWLHAERDRLRGEVKTLQTLRESLTSLQQQKQQVVQQVERRMSALCMELREIYPIGRNARGFHTICDLPFPGVETYAPDFRTAAAAMSAATIDQISPLAMSAALGYVAHLVQMMAVILNRPLRNPIVHEGSRSRIMDIIKEIPLSSREFPLYSRSSMLSKPVKYAIYLLNQNIAQLCFDITGIRCDLRGTIENIQHIFAALLHSEYNRSNSMTSSRLKIANGNNNNHNSRNGSADVVDAIEGEGEGECDVDAALSADVEDSSNECLQLLSKSHSSIDMNHVPPPLPPVLMTSPSLASGPTKLMKLTDLFQAIPADGNSIAGQALMPNAHNATQHRICRSVGSYSDCDDDDFKDNGIINDHCYSNSDSNLTFGQHGRQHV